MCPSLPQTEPVLPKLGRPQVSAPHLVAQAAASQPAPQVGIVVVNYNCLADTLRCVESLEQLSHPHHFIVVVDSCSSDGSGEKLITVLGPKGIRVVISPDNEGFAAASNVGMSLARALGADFVWLLNPDTTVAPDALSELLAEAEAHPEAAAFGSKILYGSPPNAAHPDIVWGLGGTVDFSQQQLEMCCSGEQDDGRHAASFECDYLPGCSLLVRREVLARAGFLPEEYFMYFEETDWCTRLRNLGYRLRCVPRSSVWHHFDDSKMQSPFTVYYYNRNALLFWFRYGTLEQRLRLVLKTLCVTLPRAVRALYHAPSAELEAVFRAHVLSCVDFLTGRFGKRRSFQRRPAHR